jgi:Ser-tRNA(Ala) deacylase AlaX
MRLTRTIFNRFFNIMEVKTPIYLLQPRKFELETVVASNQDGLYEFSESIFHLQGGGQPNDRGWVEVGNDKYEITGGTNERETGRVVDGPFS